MEFKTKNGGTIVVPRKAQSHLLAHPGIMEILPEVISKIILPGDGLFMAKEVEMCRIIGQSGCVKTPEIGFDEKTHFALRLERDKPSRVVLDAECQDTTKVTVLAFPSRDDIGIYILVTSFVGPLAPKEPWDRSIQSESEFQYCLEFWSTNALIYDPEVMGPVLESSWKKVLNF